MLLNEGPCVSNYPRYMAGQRFNVISLRLKKTTGRKIGWPTSFMSCGVILSNVHQCWFGWLLSDTRSVRENTQHCKINNMGVFWPTIGNRIPTIISIYCIYGIPKWYFSISYQHIPTYYQAFFGASKHPHIHQRLGTPGLIWRKALQNSHWAEVKRSQWSLVWKGCDEGFYWVIKLGELCGNLGGFRFFFPGVYR